VRKKITAVRKECTEIMQKTMAYHAFAQVLRRRPTVRTIHQHQPATGIVIAVYRRLYSDRAADSRAAQSSPAAPSFRHYDPRHPQIIDTPYFDNTLPFIFAITPITPPEFRRYYAITPAPRFHIAAFDTIIFADTLSFRLSLSDILY